MLYHVVVNEEGQYSIWRSHLPIPEGWRAVGEPGTEQECLDQVAVLWTDMRPLSLIKAAQDG